MKHLHRDTGDVGTAPAMLTVAEMEDREKNEDEWITGNEDEASKPAAKGPVVPLPARSEVWRRRKERRWLFGFAGALLLATLLPGLVRFVPAAPVLDKDSVRVDTVERGDMLFQLRGGGTLVPEDVRWAPAMSDGVVERILVLPGAVVAPDTVLVELNNPELKLDAFETESQLKAAELDLTNLQVQLDSDKLNGQAMLATAQADYATAREESDTDAQLGRIGLASALSVKEALTKTGELAKLLKIQRERLQISDLAASVQLAAQEEKIAQLAGLLDLQEGEIAGLKIRAGMAGVVQQLGDAATPLQEGQRLSAGFPVALVVGQTNFEAALQFAEAQARDIQLGQPAKIETPGGIIPGHVICIDPEVENGTESVNVALDGPLPEGVRPDMGVEGTIQLERLADVLYVGRPAQGRPNSTVSLFKVVDNGAAAVPVPVELGRVSARSVEILKGARAGDRLILSDMSRWNAYRRVALD